MYVIGEEGFSIVVNRAFHWMVKLKRAKRKRILETLLFCLIWELRSLLNLLCLRVWEGEEKLINMSLAVVDGLLALVPCNLYTQEEWYSV